MDLKDPRIALHLTMAPLGCKRHGFLKSEDPSRDFLLPCTAFHLFRMKRSRKTKVRFFFSYVAQDLSGAT